MRHPLIANLLTHRLAHGYTQLDVAAALGVSVQTVQHWEAGTRKPGFEHLTAWCEFLGVELALAPAVEAVKAA